MTTGSILKRARKRANITLRELGELVNMSASQLSNIENDQIANPLGPEEMVKASDAVKDRQMLTEYCNCCSIRSRIIVKKFPPLNNIRRGSLVAMLKVSQKTSSLAERLPHMINKLLAPDFRQDPEFMEHRNDTVLLLLDLIRGLGICLDEMQAENILNADELVVLKDMQQRLCEEKGYHKPCSAV